MITFLLPLSLVWVLPVWCLLTDALTHSDPEWR
jgi:hypothetical protein